MSLTTPEISALMSCHNSAEFIEETIESILEQDLKDFEFVIVDDASTDNTSEIVQRYTDPRIKFFQLDKNVGVGLALNYGLSKVRGRYLAKVDSDDIYLKNRFTLQKEFLDKNPEITLVKSLIEYFPHDAQTAKSKRFRSMSCTKQQQLNSIKTTEEIHETLKWWCCIPHNSIFARSDTIKSIGYVDARMGEDYHLFFRMNELGHRMACIDKTLVQFRVRDSSITGGNSLHNDYAKLLLDMKYQSNYDFFTNSKPHFIWGTGGLASGLLNALNERNLDVAGFIDKAETKHGTKYLDKSIFSPTFVEDNAEKIKISIAAQPVREEAISKLRHLGFKKTDYFVLS